MRERAIYRERHTRCNNIYLNLHTSDCSFFLSFFRTYCLYTNKRKQISRSSLTTNPPRTPHQAFPPLSVILHLYKLHLYNSTTSDPRANGMTQKRNTPPPPLLLGELTGAYLPTHLILPYLGTDTLISSSPVSFSSASSGTQLKPAYLVRKVQVAM